MRKQSTAVVPVTRRPSGVTQIVAPDGSLRWRGSVDDVRRMLVLAKKSGQLLEHSEARFPGGDRVEVTVRLIGGPLDVMLAAPRPRWPLPVLAASGALVAVSLVIWAAATFIAALAEYWPVLLGAAIAVALISAAGAERVCTTVVKVTHWH